MKTHVIVMCLLIALTCAVPASAEDRTFNDPGGAYSLSFPDYMEIRDSNQKNCLFLFSEEKALVIAVVYADAKGLPGNNIQQLCKQYPFVEQMAIAQVQQSGFNVTGKRPMNFKGIPALDYIISKENQGLSGDCIMFITRGRMFTVMVTGRATDSSQNVNIFNSVLGTMKL